MSSVVLSTSPHPGGTWIDHWLDAVPDSKAPRAARPTIGAVIDEIDRGMGRVGDQWLTNSASCNHHGVDWDPEIIQTGPAFREAVVAHPSGSRVLGSPVLAERRERPSASVWHTPGMLG